MVDKPLNHQAYIELSLFLHLSHSCGLCAYSCDLLGERERANESSLACSAQAALTLL